MTDEDYHDLQRKARAASALLESETWVEVVAEVSAAITEEWQGASWSAPSLREQKFAEMKGLKLVVDRLEKWISEAKYEDGLREKRLRRIA